MQTEKNGKKGIISAFFGSLALKVISLAFGLIAMAFLVYGGYVLYDTLYTSNKAFSHEDDYFKYKPKDHSGDEPEVDFREINEDYRFWLEIFGTRIDYPVVQDGDDLYYASKDVYRETSLTGAIYLSAFNSADLSDNYNVLYGHHMENGAMFGDLDLFMDKKFFDANKTAKITLDEEVYTLRIFAVIHCSAYDPVIYKVGNVDLNVLRNRIAEFADHIDNVDASKMTKIFAFSTCADYVTNGRLVVFSYVEDISPRSKENPTPDPSEESGSSDEPTKPTEPTDDDWTDRFVPSGESYGKGVWAILNLICLIVTIWLVLPLFSVKKKFGRNKDLKELGESLPNPDEANPDAAEEQVEKDLASEEENNPEKSEENEYFKRKRFNTHFWIGFALELATAILATWFFITHENLKNPMVLIDKWTPFMLGFLLITLIIDILFVRFWKFKKVKKAVGELEKEPDETEDPTNPEDREGEEE